MSTNAGITGLVVDSKKRASIKLPIVRQRYMVDVPYDSVKLRFRQTPIPPPILSAIDAVPSRLLSAIDSHTASLDAPTLKREQ